MIVISSTVCLETNCSPGRSGGGHPQVMHGLTAQELSNGGAHHCPPVSRPTAQIRVINWNREACQIRKNIPHITGQLHAFAVSYKQQWRIRIQNYLMVMLPQVVMVWQQTVKLPWIGRLSWPFQLKFPYVTLSATVVINPIVSGYSSALKYSVKRHDWLYEVMH